MRVRFSPIVFLPLASALAWADPPPPIAVETPPVPARLLASAHHEATTGTSIAPPLSAQTLEVPPGVNEIIPVAVGHLNRIITPFEKPEVRTVSPATTQIEGNVLYVAPADETPVTLYVTPGGNEALALSLTLAPRRIPPREIRLTLGAEQYRKLGDLQGQGRRTPASSKAMEEREYTPQDYIADLKQTFRALALRRTPPGFSLREPVAGETLRCEQPGLRVTTGQALEGRDWVILVGVVRNGGSSPVELDERSCAGSGRETLAVAAWPKVLLAPGEASELYVAVRNQPDPEAAARPSLLNGKGGRP